MSVLKDPVCPEMRDLSGPSGGKSLTESEDETKSRVVAHGRYGASALPKALPAILYAIGLGAYIPAMRTVRADKPMPKEAPEALRRLRKKYDAGDFKPRVPSTHGAAAIAAAEVRRERRRQRNLAIAIKQSE